MIVAASKTYIFPIVPVPGSGQIVIDFIQTLLIALVIGFPIGLLVNAYVNRAKVKSSKNESNLVVFQSENETNICSNCDKKVPSNAVRCRYCGSFLAISQSVSPATNNAHAAKTKITPESDEFSKPKPPRMNKVGNGNSAMLAMGSFFRSRIGIMSAIAMSLVILGTSIVLYSGSQPEQIKIEHNESGQNELRDKARLAAAKIGLLVANCGVARRNVHNSSTIVQIDAWWGGDAECVRERLRREDIDYGENQGQTFSIWVSDIP